MLRVSHWAIGLQHEGNTKEEENGYVVFKWNIQGRGDGGRCYSTRPTPFYTRFQDRYLKTTWTVFPPPTIVASGPADKNVLLVFDIFANNCVGLNQKVLNAL